MPPTYLPARTPVRAILLVHAFGLGLVLLALLVAHLRQLPLDTFVLGPLALVERAMAEIQAHPEEGIHVLARVALPPYAGVMQLTKLALWVSVVTLALRAPRARGERVALALFPLAMAQEAAFLTLDHVQPVVIVYAIYLAALACTLGVVRHDAGSPVCLVLALVWMGVRMGADGFLPDGTTLVALETLAGLLGAALWALYLASLAPDVKAGASV